jgi:Fic family protein
LGQPTLAALAATILAKRKNYYDVLERNNKTLEVTNWLVWFAATAIEAQRRTMVLIDFMVEKARLLDRLGDQLNARQRKALQRMFQEGPEGFAGGLSASNYVAITRAATATASRDLTDMVAKGALVRSGERRHARYQVNIPLQAVMPVVIDEYGRIGDPGIESSK